MQEIRPAGRTNRSNLIAAASILVGLLLITYLHYSTAPGLAGLHAVYRYFYFLPIVYAALRFGFRGGLLAALAASLLFAPHIVFKWGNFPEDSINDLLVVIVFFGVAVITGITVDRLRASQQAESQTAAELATSLRKLEEQGDELRRVERLSALGNLAGGLAHQIRNPVGIIRACAQLLEADSQAEARETALVIEEETDRIEVLVQDLLRYADVTRPQLAPTDAANFLEGIAVRVQPMASAAGVEVQTVSDARLPLVLIDSRQMEQVLLNLAVNAIQAVDQGGAVVLAARQGKDLQHVEFRVSDDGPGIDEADRQRIFDPFFSTKDDGSGLGLSVVNRIVEDHGARVTVANNPDAGTTFVVHLSAAPLSDALM